MTAVVRIQHIATVCTAVIVTRHRADVPAVEPHSLVSADCLQPGDAVSVTLQEGEVLTVHEHPRRRDPHLDSHGPAARYLSDLDDRFFDENQQALERAAPSQPECGKEPTQ